MSKNIITKKGPETIVTNDYDMFEPFEFNRDIRKTEQLKQSMEKYGFDEGSALNCRRKENGKLQIIQGHHRFKVAKGLGIPVVAIISGDAVPVWSLERGTHPWNVVDYITGFAREGRRQYQELLQFHEESGIAASECIAMLRGGSGTGTCYSDMAKQGDFEINHRAFANRVAGIVHFMKNKGHSCASQGLFLRALRNCMMLPEWSDDRWMQKLETHGALLERQPDVDRYLKNIETIYNRQCRDEDRFPVAFSAKEAARTRGHKRAKENKTR